MLALHIGFHTSSVSLQFHRSSITRGGGTTIPKVSNDLAQSSILSLQEGWRITSVANTGIYDCGRGIKNGGEIGSPGNRVVKDCKAQYRQSQISPTSTFSRTPLPFRLPPATNNSLQFLLVNSLPSPARTITPSHSVTSIRPRA